MVDAKVVDVVKSASDDSRNKKSKSDSVPDLTALRELFRPHIESFDHMTETGLKEMCRHIKPIVIVQDSTELRMRLQFSSLLPPSKTNRDNETENLFPFECRQAKVSYSGLFYANLSFQYIDKKQPEPSDKQPSVKRPKLLYIDKKQPEPSDEQPSVKRPSEKWDWKDSVEVNFGLFPIMLQSGKCNLKGADPQELVSRKEEASEMGGYFICNGLERVIRLQILPKRNYPLSLVHNSFCKRREGFTDKAVVIRCVRSDQSSVTVKLYYLENGSARVSFWIKREEYLLPAGIVLKALNDISNQEIYEKLITCYNEKYEKDAVGTQFVGERAEIILQEVKSLHLSNHLECLEHIGKYFKSILAERENDSSKIVADAVLKDYIFVHLDNNIDKFNLLIFMLQKLFSLVDKTSVPDSPDSLQNQEVLLPGHLITIYLKEKLEDWLQQGKKLIEHHIAKKSDTFNLRDILQVKKILKKKITSANQVSEAVENMLVSGRLVTKTGLDLPQTAGYTVQADRLNFLRFLSHFRSVHRGSSFAGHRFTTVRKLLPESWGFLCPVHTHEGGPCGLLNHMTCSCRITSGISELYDSKGNLIKQYTEYIKNFIRSIIKKYGGELSGLDIDPKLDPGKTQMPPERGLPKLILVLLDGCIIGSISSLDVDIVVAQIRQLKISAKIPSDLEVGYVPLSMGGAYPGLYLFTTPGRFIRPVRNITIPSNKSGDVELIGPFEQVFMDIRCPDGGDGGVKYSSHVTHEEVCPTGMLSVVANLTPWSDHNQSRQNIYQCQLAKKSMSFSSQTNQCRADNKSYCLQSPQSPIVRTPAYSRYNINEFPTGTNAIVAVLAYTGYDMKDALILNKSSVERGMFHGQIYQTETIDLTKQRRIFGKDNPIFREDNPLDRSCSTIDSDGLPHVGQMIRPKEPYYSTYEVGRASEDKHIWKGSGPVYVDYVSLDVKDKKSNLQKANIRFRHPRNPVVGDKFSSRHGQKGICSQLWPDIDMPFSGTTGMRPDLIINPHAFPSRMTIAMLLESIAAKGGSLSGNFVDATTFRSSMKKDKKQSESESGSLVDDLGVILKEKKFNYHGSEVLYSGVYGTELTCEIFIGPVYYHRLRHIVSDKLVRSTGATDQDSRQPTKTGSIRFGEMERDSLLAHGAAYLLHDRLHSCSDYHIADVCSLCGSMFSTSITQPGWQAGKEMSMIPGVITPKKKITCDACQSSKNMDTVAMPYVFRLLAAELAAMNIKMTLKLRD